MHTDHSNKKEIKIIEVIPEPTQSAQDVTAKKPEEVFTSHFLPAYSQLHQDIWRRLIRVDANIQILETIGRFPLHHLYAPQENIFWTMVFCNFFQISVILLHSLVSDQTKGAHTLPKFRNSVLNHLRTDSLKSAYSKRLSQIKLDKQLDPIRKNIAGMRHDLIAHRFLDDQGHLKAPHVEGVTVSTLRKVFEDVKRLFETCSFGSEYSTSLYPATAPGHKPPKKDIEQILNLIVKYSYWLNQPERRAPFWQQIKPHKAREDIEELNRWRAKFNLPPA